MKKDLRTYHSILPLAFLLLLVLPIINDSIHFVEFERKDENRSFTDTIEFNVNNLDQFPKNFNNYVNDNFAFRRPLLTIFHYSKFYFFKTTPHPDKLIIGKDNWYFNGGEEKRIVEGTDDYNKEQLDTFSAIWKKRLNFIDSMGAKAYWIIAPMKHSIYPEKLPYYIHQAKETKSSKLKNRINQDFPDLIIDPNEALKEGGKSIDVFYRLDNHWNFKAGKIVSQLILDRIKKDFPNHEIGKQPPIIWEKKIKSDGIQGRLIGVENLFEEYLQPSTNTNYASIAQKKYNFKGIEGFAYNWDFEMGFSNNRLKKGLRILIIRDSFGEQLIPFMRDSFKESLWIFDAWRYGLNEDIILRTKPDIILFIGLETHTNSILKKIN